MLRFFGYVLLVLTLTGCGAKGPLYLPQSQTPAALPPPAPKVPLQADDSTKIKP